MYFCNGLRPEGTTKRSGRYKTIVYDSHNVTNDFAFDEETKTLKVVEGDYIVFCLNEFGFYGEMQIDVITCNDFMLVKLLEGEIYIKGENGVILGVNEEGTVEAIEESGKSAITWYNTDVFSRILDGCIRYENGVPETNKNVEFIRNNIIATMACSVTVVKNKNSGSSCALLRLNLVESMPGYNFEKAIEDAKVVRNYADKLKEQCAASHAHYLAHKEEIDKQHEELKAKAKTKVVKTKTNTKSKKHTDDFIDEDSDYEERNEMSAYEDEEDIDTEFGDYEDDDGLTSDDIREIEFDLKMKQASAMDYEDSEDL